MARKIVLASGKGGVGKSSLTAGIAIELCNMGLVNFVDSESGKRIWIDTCDAQTRKAFGAYRQKQRTDCINELTKHGIDNTAILCGEDYIPQLAKLFAKKERR